VSLTDSRMGMLCFEIHQVSVVMNMQQGATYEVRVYCACISYAWGTMLVCREQFDERRMGTEILRENLFRICRRI
jgi:hypothetical protein